MHNPAKSRQRKESDRLIPQSMIPAVRISVLASSSVIAPPFKTFPVRFKICSQLLFIVKHSFFNPPTAWPGLAFVIPYVSYVIEIFVFDNGNISMHLLIVTGYLGNRK